MNDPQTLITCPECHGLGYHPAIKCTIELGFDDLCRECDLCFDCKCNTCKGSGEVYPDQAKEYHFGRIEYEPENDPEKMDLFKQLGDILEP